MKKIISILVVILVAYLATTYYIGIKVEKKLENDYKILMTNNERQGYIKNRSYQRSIFSANEVVDIEIPAEMTKSGAPLLIRANSKIMHGPFVGNGFALAKGNTEFVFDKDVNQVITSIYKDKKPLSINWTVKFDSSADVDITSPAVEIVNKNLKINWQGLNINGNVSKNFKTIKSQVEIPKLKIDFKCSEDDSADCKDFIFEINGISGYSDKVNPYDEAFKVFIGKDQMSFSELSLSIPELNSLQLNLSKSTLSQETTQTGEYLKTSAQGEIASTSLKLGTNFKQGHLKLDAINYDIDVSNIHLDTFIKVLDSLSNLSNNSTNNNKNRATEELFTQLLALLMHRPQINVKNFSINYQEFPSKASSVFKINSPNEEQKAMIGLLGVFALVDLVDFSANISLHKKLKENLSTVDENFDGEIDVLLALGYLLDDGDSYKSIITFRNSELLINGKPLQ